MLTVLLATHDGTAVLPEVLDGYCGQSLPADEWRLAVVDNASTDGTAELVQSYADRLPLILLSAERPGKNSALNIALAALDLSAGLFVLTDDDAVPTPNFLSVWSEVAARGAPDRLYGGTVKLRFRAGRPSHLTAFETHFPELYAENIRPSGEINPGQIFGPNMAVPGRVFRNGIRFEEAIGPNSGNAAYPMGSETEFCVRAARELGLRAQFVSEAEVEHIVREHQTRLTFIKARAYRHGRGVAVQQQLQTERPQWRTDLRRISAAVSGWRHALNDDIWEQEWIRGYRDGMRLR